MTAPSTSDSSQRLFADGQRPKPGPESSPGSRRGLAAVLAIVLFLPGGVSAQDSELEPDDQVVFFPTSGNWDPGRREWTLPVRGWVYKPEEDSTVRAATLDGLRRLLDLNPSAEEAPVFKRRAWPFVVDNERGRELSIRLGDRYFFLEESEANGHCRGVMRLPPGDAAALLKAPAAEGRWLTYTALTGDGDDREFAGKVQLLGARGVSIISDIDDTIRASHVRDRRKLLEGTFLKRFAPVPGMAAQYRRWGQEGAAFHYVSAGPWQLFAPLEQFRLAEGFPAGSFDMQLFRWKDRTVLNLTSPPDELKRPAIEALLARYPQRQFVCIGDSGQSDPELYGGLARQRPGRIVQILIRNVSGETADAERFRAAFQGLPAESWRLFSDAEELNALSFTPPATPR